MALCSWEDTMFNDGELYALDIPPEVSLPDAYSKLESAKQKGICLFEEGFVGHPLDDRPARVQ